MNSLQHTAKLAINLGKQLKAVIEVGEFLEQLGQYEAVAAEAERHTVDAKFRREKAEREHQQVVTDLKLAQEALEQTRNEEVELRQEAEYFAEAITRKAKENATKLLKTAAADASTMILKAGLKVKADQQVSEDLAKEIFEQQAELDHARNQMAALKESLG